MEKLLKITLSPFTQPIENFADLSVTVTAPYSDKFVTIKINSGINDYNENLDQPWIQVRQATEMIDTDDTINLKLDFWESNIKRFVHNWKRYEIKLMSIWKEELEWDSFSNFEFYLKN